MLEKWMGGEILLFFNILQLDSVAIGDLYII